ncbi:MAG: hypothetical protein H6667_00025 [Ardenticatenaceae bacterium]|nr:hypothetical protein [Ardenticatenaceae bacterium]
MPNDYDSPKESAKTRDAGIPPDKPDSGLSDAGISAMQGPPDAPAEHTPQRAHGDAGDAERAETGAEKTEKKDFYGPANPEGSAPTPPEGWRPGGPER